MATNPLPKWIMKKYALLWQKFGNQPFTLDDFRKIDKNQNHANILSRLRRQGWLSARMDQKDARRRTYFLTPPEDAIKNMREVKK